LRDSRYKNVHNVSKIHTVEKHTDILKLGYYAKLEGQATFKNSGNQRTYTLMDARK